MTSLKKLLNILFAALIVITLTGCPDFGNYDVEEFSSVTEDNFSDAYEDYFDAWGDVKLYDEDVSSKSISIKDSLFTYTTVDKLDWGENDTPIDFDNYMFMAIKANRDMNIDSLSLYLKTNTDDSSNNSVKFNVGLVVQNSIFSNVPKLFDIFDDNEDYDLPNIADVLGVSEFSINNNSWDSFTIDMFDNNQTYEIHSGDYIILIFYNNTIYGQKQTPQLTSVEFTMLNLMIRVI